MHVEHFMTRNPVACDWQASLRDVAGTMEQRGVGCVVVLRDGKVWGLATDRQVACRGVGQGLDPSTPIDAICTHNPAKLTLEDNIFSAVDTLRSAGMVRRVPVVNDNGELLGIVSLSDIAVVAKDLLDAIVLDETHHSLTEARVPTGGKSIANEIGRPTTDVPRNQDVRPITQPSVGTSRSTEPQRTTPQGVRGDEERHEGWKRSWWPFG
ncbi:MAG: CBS domain-containing protein [Halobacteriales archaeon]|nr:CBS domain-containing protein [Halobacteriales archaeon]